MEELRKIKDDIAAIRSKRPSASVAIKRVRPPFVQDILYKKDALEVPIATDPPYHGQAESADAIDNLSAFTDWGVLHGYSNAILYKAFPLCLAGATWSWYDKLNQDP